MLPTDTNSEVVENDWKYEDFRLPVAFVSIFLTIIGILPHGFIIFCSCRKAQLNENKAFAMLLRINSIFACIYLFCGGLISNRHEVGDGFVVFVSYGLAGYFGNGLACSILDFLPTQYVALSPILIVTMTLFRLLILEGVTYKKRHVASVFILLFLITMPLSVLNHIYYTNVAEVSSIFPESLRVETSVVTSYALKMNSVMMVTHNISNIISASCVIIGFFLSWRIYRHLKTHEALMTFKTKRHLPFFKVLSIDVAIMGVYTLVTQFHWIPVPYKANLLLNVFNFAVFSFPTISQGYLTIFLVPWLRRALATVMCITPNNIVAPVSITSLRDQRKLPIAHPIGRVPQVVPHPSILALPKESSSKEEFLQ